MKYLEKSFTLPASPVVTQEAWDKIWNPPPATESENLIADTVAPAQYPRLRRPLLATQRCSNCHCDTVSYRHIETCVTPGESD